MTEIVVTRNGETLATAAREIPITDLTSLSILYLDDFFKNDQNLDVDHSEIWFEGSLLDNPTPQTLTAYVDVLTVGATKPIRYVIHLAEKIAA